MDCQNDDPVGNPANESNGAGDAHDECEDEEIEYLLDDKPQMVMKGLFIGSAWAEMNEPELTKAGITDILQVAQGMFPRHPLLFTYMILQVEDYPDTDLVRYFPKCFDFIDTALSKGGSVLVHCAAGVSRSATVVLGYLMSHHSLTLAAALDHLKAVRPWVAPNPGFLQQLAAYEAAKCDLRDWKPWHLVWYEQQQQQQRQQQEGVDGVAAMDLLSLPPQPQQQHWLRLPQPGASGSACRQQQQQALPPLPHQQQQALPPPPHQQQQQQHGAAGCCCPPANPGAGAGVCVGSSFCGSSEGSSSTRAASCASSVSCCAGHGVAAVQPGNCSLDGSLSRGACVRHNGVPGVAAHQQGSPAAAAAAAADADSDPS